MTIRQQIAAALNKHVNPGIMNAQMEDIMPIIDPLIHIVRDCQGHVAGELGERLDAILDPLAEPLYPEGVKQ